MTAGGAGEPLVRIAGVAKSFDGHKALDGVSLDIGRGEFVALLGPSGCGKTTLLRLLAGFETPDAGTIALEGRDLTALPPYRRPVNMMFQSYALFPHMTVAGNVAFGLKQEGMAGREIEARVSEMLRLVALSGLEKRRPHQLSGGQCQRVALARALVKRPVLLLLDEPLAALDKRLREQTQGELKALQRRLGIAFVVVTHDQSEALTLADRLAVMDHGHIVQVGPPAEVYERPNSRYVARFLGDVNLVEGTVMSVDGGFALVRTAAGELRVARGAASRPGASVAVALRPEKLVPAHESDDVNVISGAVEDLSYRGDRTVLRLRVADALTLTAAVQNRAGAAAAQLGEPARFRFEPDDAVVLP